MKYAICNELFAGWEFGRVCRAVRELGYAGLEVAPFTLAPLVTDISAACRAELRRQAAEAGIELLGLHWLLAKTEGFSITSPDADVRQRTADYLGELARCCRDLGGSLLVLGSPAARKIPPGFGKADAIALAADTIGRMTSVLDETAVVLAVEPLAPTETDFLQTADEAVELLDRIAHPRVRLHLDVKAMAAEALPIPAVIRRHAARTAHFHANDPNLRGPGMGAVRFEPIFAALRETGYSGWVSVEVFDFAPDPVTIARDSIDYMRRCTAG